MPTFIHLRLHSEYSLVDGLVRVDELASRCASLGMPAVALTDHMNLFAAVKFQSACERAGVKSIFGADLRVRVDDDEPVTIPVLVRNADGYANLIHLLEIAQRGTTAGARGVIGQAALQSHATGLIVLSGGPDGDVGRLVAAGQPERAAAAAARWRAALGDDYYLELQRTGRPDEDPAIVTTVGIAVAHDIPVVATNNVRFLAADQHDAHEVRVCIHGGQVLDDPHRQRRFTDQQYLRSADEMASLFADLPQALANTVEIARKCSYRLALGRNFLPDYPLPAGTELKAYFEQVSREGLALRMRDAIVPARVATPDQRAGYQSRLDMELAVISKMGFAGYYLIVMEFIAWARANGVPVGPGRGSGAGSLVAYALGITDIDPLQYELLFERFLNPERVSMPDFDVDFCMEGRDAVIAHVADHYGHDAVSQIVTFGTMAAKAVVRDVARAMGKPYGLADRLSKLIPMVVGMTLDKAIAEAPELAAMLDTDPDAAEIMDMARQLEGIVRNVGKHAGGVVIAPHRVTDHVPVLIDEAGGLVTQFDKDDVEQAGLVKFDFLGLRTLTIIDWAVAAINARRASGEAALRIEAIPLDDRATFDLLRSGETTAVFQLESSGMKDLIRRLQPDTLEDVIALVALYRPGPLGAGMVDDFVDRKHGREPVVFPHPDLQGVLKNTYGVILYQEQVMQIAQVLAGFSLGQADLLRRAMGKKKPEEMARQRAEFEDGAQARGVDAAVARQIFDLMEKFAGYGFNKSHSAAYALVSYQTAWLKAHHPAEFMAAVMSADMQNTDKIVTLIEECRRMRVEVLPPDVNRGSLRFTVEDGRILYGLGAIKGVGPAPIEAIVAARAAGRFDDLVGFVERIDTRAVNRRVLEALVRSGALDGLTDCDDPDEARPLLLALLDVALQNAGQRSRNAVLGMTDLFGGDEPSSRPGIAEVTARIRRSVVRLSLLQRLEAERDTLGVFLTGHPLEHYRDDLGPLGARRIADLAASDKPQRIAGYVVDLRFTRSRSGDNLAFAQIDDRSGRVEVMIGSDLLARSAGALAKGRVVVIDAKISEEEDTGRVRVRSAAVTPIEEARRRNAHGIRIRVPCGTGGRDAADRLALLLGPWRRADDGVELRLDLEHPLGRAELVLGPAWRVDPSDQLLESLRGAFASVDVCYGGRGAA